MSAFGGFCYWDRHPIPTERLAVLAEHLQVAGPDASGTLRPTPWTALQAHLLHFDRLSTQERQPHSFGRECVLTWDGRLDNREDLRLTLHRLLRDDHSDAAIVGAAYEQWGIDAIPRLIGDWALAVWDGEHQRVVLARDYIGNRPLYYRPTRDGLAWATRLEALAVCEHVSNAPDESFIAAYVAGEAPADMTPFTGIFPLQGGNLLVATRDGLTVRRYWHYSPTVLRYRRLDEYADHLRVLLTEAVRARLRSRRPVWAHLSGGWDSSSVVCLAHRLIAQGSVEAPRLSPISIVYPEREATPEREHIADVAQWCGISSTLHSRQGDPTFAEMLGHRVFVPRTELHRLDLLVRTAGDHIVLTGIVGDLIAKRVAPGLALSEAWRDGQFLTCLRRLIAWAREERLPLATLFARILRTALPTRASRRSTGAHAENVSPDLLRRIRSRTSPAPPSDRDFPVTARPLVHTLYSMAQGGHLNIDEIAAPVWQTHPYSHRPLIEFLLAVPRLAMFEPQFARAGMRRALSEILPASILNRRRKVGIPRVSVKRLMSLNLERMKDAPPLTDTASHWQLVQRGIITEQTLTSLIETLRTNPRPSDFLERCVTAEAWLRTTSTSTADAPRAVALVAEGP